MIACSLVPMSCQLNRLADCTLEKYCARWGKKGSRPFSENGLESGR